MPCTFQSNAWPRVNRWIDAPSQMVAKASRFEFRVIQDIQVFSILQPSPSLKERRVVFCLLGSARLSSVCIELCSSLLSRKRRRKPTWRPRHMARHGPTWPDMARFPCHFSSFCEAKAKRSGLLSEGFWQRTKTSTVCSLAQVREKFGKHMFEQCLFEHQVEGCRARFRPRTDGVGVPPLFSQGGVAFLCSKSVGCLLERSRKIWKDLERSGCRLFRGLWWLVGAQRRWVRVLDFLSLRDGLRCGWHASQWVVRAERVSALISRWLHNKTEMAYFHLFGT